jgi:hypothetical protein
MGIIKFGHDDYEDFHQDGVIESSTRQNWKKNYEFDVSDDLYNEYVRYLKGQLDGKSLYNVLSKEILDFHLTTVLVIPNEIPKVVKNVKKPKKKAQKKREARKRNKQKKMRLRVDMPKYIPYNVELNDGEDSECVIRAIKPKQKRVYPNQKRDYTGKTIQDLIDYCEELKRPCDLRNIFGRPIYKNNYPKLDHYPSVTGICHDEHFYPMVKGDKKIKLNSETILNQDPSEEFIYFTDNGKRITVGVHKDKEDLDYTFDFPKSSWDPETLDIMTRVGCRPLSHSEGAESGYTIDKNKCYYTIATDGTIKDYGILTIFDTFKKWENTEVNVCNFYKIKPDDSLLKLGITTNVIGGRTLTSLINNGRKVEILEELACSSTKRWEKVKIEEVFEGANKKFNIYNGITGKTDFVKTRVINIENDSEREAILEDEEDDFTIVNDTMLSTQHKYTKYVNHFHRYLAVLDAANSSVLEVLFKINKPVLKIVTDSLTFSKEVKAPIGWKKEMFKYKTATNGCMREYTGHIENDFSQNKTILGAPGTGKSHLMRNTEEYDYSCAYTNKAANGTTNIKTTGQTIHKLFGIFTGEKLAHLRGKTVWVDEISMIPRVVWGYMLEAYMNYDTIFKFTGDFNQTAPVGEEKLHWIPFMGEVKTLTKDYRNSPALVAMREAIINGEEIKIKKSRKDYPMINIAFTNATCKKVNESIVEREKITWGDSGSQVCSSLTIKKYFIAKNESFEVESSDSKFVRLKGIEYDIPRKIFDKSFVWGYCMTVHKAQGDTIKEDIGIHEFHRMPVDVKYTAITRVLDVLQLNFY